MKKILTALLIDIIVLVVFRSKDYVENVEKEYIEKFKAVSQYDLASLYTFFNQLSERYHIIKSEAFI